MARSVSARVRWIAASVISNELPHLVGIDVSCRRGVYSGAVEYPEGGDDTSNIARFCDQAMGAPFRWGAWRGAGLRHDGAMSGAGGRAVPGARSAVRGAPHSPEQRLWACAPHNAVGHRELRSERHGARLTAERFVGIDRRAARGQEPGP